MDEDIHDIDLPLHCDGQYNLAKKTNSGLVPIQRCLIEWKYPLRYAFYDHQWRVQAPVFHKGSPLLKDHPAQQLASEAIIPWTAYEEVYDKNSEVVRVKNHKAHRPDFKGVRAQKRARC